MLPLAAGLVYAHPEFDKSAYKKANALFEEGYYHSALQIYLKLFPEDSLNAKLNYRIGVCYFDTKTEKAKSFQYFKRSYENGTDEAAFYLAWCYQLRYEFSLATKYFMQYDLLKGNRIFTKEEVLKHLKEIKIAIDLKQTAEEREVVPIKPNINTVYDDYTPLISADESFMIFTSRRKGSTGNKLDPHGRYFEDIYISYNDSLGDWQKANSIGANINTESHDACVGLSADGRTLIVYRTDETGISGDLYHSYLEGNEWSTPEKLPGYINSTFIESSAAVSSDGNMMIFSSTRAGGFGGKDLYRIVKLGNGEWSLPQNLGAAINGPYDEDAPFLHADGKTLYFSTNGDLSMGGYDVVKSSFDRQERRWLKPKNLGYPINTPDDDIFFVLTTNGQKGYYSSYGKKGIGNADIYQINFNPNTQNLLVIKTKVLDASGAPLKGKVLVFEKGNKKRIAEYNANPNNGKILMILDKQKTYVLVTSADDYKTSKETVFYHNVAMDEIQKTITLKPNDINPEK